MPTNITTINRQLDLGVAVREFVQRQEDYIGTKVAPVVPMDDEQGTYYAMTRESIMSEPTDEELLTGDDGSTPLDTTTLRPFSYLVRKRKLGELLPDRRLKKLNSVFDYEVAVAEKLAGKLLTQHEKRVAAKLFNTSTFTGASLYTDDSSSHPWATTSTKIATRLEVAAEIIRGQTGYGLERLSLIVNQTNLNRMLANEDLRERSIYVAEATRAQLIQSIAAKIGLKEVVVGSAVRNTANKAQAFASGPVWSSNYVMLAVLSDNPSDFRQPTIARTILWQRSTPDIFTVDQFRDDDREGTVYRVKSDTDEHLADPSFGHLIKVA